MTNAHRGEMNVTIGKAKFKLALEHERISEIETETGVGVIALCGRFMHLADNATIRDLMVSPVSFDDVVTVFWIANGKEYGKEQLSKVILAEGLLSAVTPIGEFLSLAVAGGATETGEEEAGEE